MVTLMRDSWPHNTKLCVILCDCLYHLAKFDKPTKAIIRSEGGTELLFRILKTAEYHKLIEKTLYLIQVLSTDPEIKKEIIQNFGTDEMAKKLHYNMKDPEKRHQTNKVPYYAASAMRNVSDAVDKLKNPEQVVLEILNSLHQPQGQWPEKVRDCVLGTLGNLLAKMPELRLRVLEKGGMQLLFDLLGQFNRAGPEHHLIEPLLCALK